MNESIDQAQSAKNETRAEQIKEVFLKGVCVKIGHIEVLSGGVINIIVRKED
jgi:hypothetical protein